MSVGLGPNFINFINFNNFINFGFCAFFRIVIVKLCNIQVV